MSKITIALLLCFSPILNAALPNCEVKGSPENPRLATIRLLDGREILMLGINHGDRELPFAITGLIRARPSRVELHASIQGLTATVAAALEDERTDLDFVRTLLKENPSLHFVGFETEDRFARANLENYAKMLVDFRTQVESLDPASMPLERDLEKIVLGAAGYLALNEPKLFEAREIRGFESAQGTGASAQATALADSALEELRKLAAGDKSFLSNVGGTDLQLSLMYADYTADVGAKVLEQARAASIPPKYRDATLNWIQLKLNEMAADKSRELDVVANILNANASGILIMGAAHLPGIMAELQKNCMAGGPKISSIY